MSLPDPNTTGTTIEDKSLDKESIINLLGEDDNAGQDEVLDLTEPKPKKAETSKDEKEDKEEKDEKEEGKEEEVTLEDELELDLEEPDEKELELLEPPSRKEILTAYPDLFKKFPQLETAMYREKAYSKLLPTIEDAKTAVEKSQLLDQYEKEIMGGSTESLLTTVKDNDKKSFAKVVDNYLPTLYKVDQNAYYHTIANITKHTIITMVRDAKEQNDEDLANAAAILNKYVFGTTNFQHPTNLSGDDVADSESTKKQEELSRKEKEFTEQQYNAAEQDLGRRIDNTLKSSVDRVIDPNNSMSEFVKSKAVKQVLEDLENVISRDTRFTSIYDRLWEKAAKSNFNQESMDSVRKAYLSKAQTLLPILIKKVRAQALKGVVKRDNNGDGKDRKGPIPPGKTRSSTTLASGSAKGSPSKSIPKGMSTLDYLNSDD